MHTVNSACRRLLFFLILFKKKNPQCCPAYLCMSYNKLGSTWQGILHYWAGQWRSLVSFAAPCITKSCDFYIKPKVSDTDKERGFRYFRKDQLSAGHMEKYFIDISCNELKWFIWKTQKQYFNFSLLNKHFLFCLTSRSQNASETFILIRAVSSSWEIFLISETLLFVFCPTPISLFLIRSNSSLTRPSLSSKNTSHPTHCRENFRILKLKTEDKEQQQKQGSEEKSWPFWFFCLFGFGCFGFFWGLFCFAFKLNPCRSWAGEDAVL